jgi:hypothetical protein
MTSTQAQRKELHRLVRRFAILRGWTIVGHSCPAQIAGYTTVLPHDPSAVVWLWGGTPPPDFLLHEVLHCALRAFSRLDKRKPKELRQAEEQLVRDICAVTRKP